MERRRSGTRAGEPVWTPAPGYSSSPPSPTGSQLSWVEGGEEDFQSQMDENGIIGLSGGVGEMDEDEEVLLEEEEEDDVLLGAGTPEPEKGPPPALDDLSCNLSELLDSEPFSQPTADDDDDNSLALEDWSDGEDGQEPHEELPESFKIRRQVRDMVLSLTADGTEEAKELREPSFPLKGEVNPKYSWVKGEDDSNNKTNDNLATSENHRRTSETPTSSQNQSIEIPHISSHLSSKNYLHQLSQEEPAWNFGPETAETFPERTSQRCTPGTSQPRFGEEQSEEPECSVTPQLGRELQTKIHHHHALHQPPAPVPRTVRCAPQESPQSSAPAQLTDKPQSSSSDSSPLNTPHHRRHRGHRPCRPSHTDLKDVRNGKLTHPLPDFSKVEPKVRFPKGDYKPPRSRRPPRKRDWKPDAPLMYRSPAEMVREVLLSSTEGLSDTASPGELQRPVDSAETKETLCPLQASSLVQQLQDDYNRLLTKYAEAENTIDRLRLEAKVGLQSVSPRSSQSALRGVLNSGSKVMTLSFPQAQRAELSTNTIRPTQERINTEASNGIPPRPSSVDSISPRGHLSLTAAQLTDPLSKQLQTFQLQVDEFEKLLKSGRLKPYEQIQGLSQLTQGQDSLEKAYLAARDQYQQMQKQTREKSSAFDPERELESQIFNSGLRLEELKERMEQSEQNEPRSEPGPSPRPHAHQLCAPLNETVPQPETPVSAAHSEDTVELEVSSVNEGSDGDKEEDAKEEVLPSVLHPLLQKHTCVEKDFSSLMEQYQSFRELPVRLARVRSESRRSLEFRASPPGPAVSDAVEDDQQWRTKDEVDSSRSVDHSSSGSSHLHSKETLPATTLPGPHSSERRPSASSTSHRNLGESSAFTKRASKQCDRVLRAPLQDGVASPETDSGFLGSESSRLTPAVHSPVQQRTALRFTRPSVAQESCTVKRETVSVSGHRALGSQAQTQTPPTRSQRAPGSTGEERRGGPTGRRYLPSSPSTSSSPLRLSTGPLQPCWSDSAPSLSGEEARQDDGYTQPANQNGSYLRSPSPAVPYRHSDHLKAQSSVQLTNRHEALQSLQDEVDRLREHLEGSLRTSPSSPVRARCSVLEDFRNPKPSHTSTPVQPNLRSLVPRAANKRTVRESRRSEEEEERRTTPKPEPRRRSASLPRFTTELSDITTDSEHAQSDPRPQTLRYFPVSPTKPPASPRARAEPKPRSRRTGQQRSRSPVQSEEDEDDDECSRGPGPALCMLCTARENSRTSARRVRNVSSPSHTGQYSGCCPLCGASKPKRTRVPSPPNQSSIQRDVRRPVSSTHRERGCVYLAAAPPPTVLGRVHMVQYVPVFPTVLYYSSPAAPPAHPKPLYPSRSSDDRGHKSGVGHHHRRSQSVDPQHSFKRSLDRAITAARSMHEVSQRMTRSLASGLQNTNPLAQSCSY